MVTYLGPLSFFEDPAVDFRDFCFGAGMTLMRMNAGSNGLSMNGGLVTSCTINTYSPTKIITLSYCICLYKYKSIVSFRK